MKNIFSCLVVFLTVSLSACPTHAQYMFLDSDGDGRSTSADRLSSMGPTVVDIWLDTGHNKDGSPITCVSDPSLGVIATGYEIAIHAQNGNVSWGPYQNMVPGLPYTDSWHSDSVFASYAVGTSPITPGMRLIGRLTLTASSACGGLSLRNEGPYPTAIVTQWGSCAGFDFDNLLKPGTGEYSDWHDADGLLPAPSADAVSLPAHITGDGPLSFKVRVSDPARIPGGLEFDASSFPSSSEPRFSMTSDGKLGTFQCSMAAVVPGTYQATFFARDSPNIRVTTAVLRAPDRSPTVQLPTPPLVLIGQSLQMDVSCVDPDGDTIDSLAGDFSDFAVTSQPALRVTGPGMGRVSWTPRPEDAGWHDVVITCRNSLAGSGVVRLRATSKPTASLVVVSDGYSAPLPVTLDASSSRDPDGVLQSYSFDFGDGYRSGSASASRATHTMEDGTFTGTAIVTDDTGVSDTAAASVTVPRSGPFMFLDVDGDSLATKWDRLSLDGPNLVTVWLDTRFNRVGRDAYCSTDDGELTLNSYEIALRASNGSVQWDSIRNLQPTMELDLGRKQDATQLYFVFAGPTILPPGKYPLAEVGITRVSGNPTINIVSSLPIYATAETSFGSVCTGLDLDNTLKLGRDWFDVAGIESGPGVTLFQVWPEDHSDLAKSTFCFNAEPVANGVGYDNINPSSLRLRRSDHTGPSVLAAKEPVEAGMDTNADRKAEIRVCFPSDGVRSLVGPGGTASLELSGLMSNGSELRGIFDISVSSSSGSANAQIVPNPLTAAGFLRLSGASSAEIEISVFDVAGRRVMMKKLRSKPVGLSGTVDLDIPGLAALSSGIYFFKGTSGKRSISGKFVILR